jgi:hypothetical protein
VVEVDVSNWQKVADTVKRFNFGFDEAVEELFFRVSNSHAERSKIETTDEIKVTVTDDWFLNNILQGMKDSF